MVDIDVLYSQTVQQPEAAEHWEGCGIETRVRVTPALLIRIPSLT